MKTLIDSDVYVHYPRDVILMMKDFSKKLGCTQSWIFWDFVLKKMDAATGDGSGGKEQE